MERKIPGKRFLNMADDNGLSKDDELLKLCYHNLSARWGKENTGKFCQEKIVVQEHVEENIYRRHTKIIIQEPNWSKRTNENEASYPGVRNLNKEFNLAEYNKSPVDKCISSDSPGKTKVFGTVLSKSEHFNNEFQTENKYNHILKNQRTIKDMCNPPKRARCNRKNIKDPLYYEHKKEINLLSKNRVHGAESPVYNESISTRNQLSKSTKKLCSPHSKMRIYCKITNTSSNLTQSKFFRELNQDLKKKSIDVYPKEKLPFKKRKILF